MCIRDSSEMLRGDAGNYDVENAVVFDEDGNAIEPAEPAPIVKVSEESRRRFGALPQTDDDESVQVKAKEADKVSLAEFKPVFKSKKATTANNNNNNSRDTKISEKEVHKEKESGKEALERKIAKEEEKKKKENEEALKADEKQDLGKRKSLTSYVEGLLDDKERPGSQKKQKTSNLLSFDDQRKSVLLVIHRTCVISRKKKRTTRTCKY
eukprot:TRINITY_DN2446_c0_g1_i2.p1 TRINITY_DN2446_c0_g1~~TRINITY_DN2446_c0_g1_i2.p1  ORF type:complete len:245 (-),score=72.56 TRINITY_DN2446_c0_g1_i2:163-792(-)